MNDRTTVGFIGLGDQGAPIAARILANGYPLRVWARRRFSTEALEKAGASVDETKAALAARCDIVGICVATDDQVRDVLLGPEGVFQHLAPGKIVLVHSTISPGAMVELDAIAREHGVHLLDAPVSGGAAGAHAGTMTVMIGGDAETLSSVDPVLKTFARTIFHLGPVGAGQTAKLINNNLTYANVTMGIAALELASKLGVDQAVIAEVISISSGASHGFELLVRDDRFAKLMGGLGNVQKDVAAFVGLLDTLDLGDDALTAVSAHAADRVAAFASRRIAAT